jgi:hypothetical protein
MESIQKPNSIIGYISTENGKDLVEAIIKRFPRQTNSSTVIQVNVVHSSFGLALLSIESEQSSGLSVIGYAVVPTVRLASTFDLVKNTASLRFFSTVYDQAEFFEDFIKATRFYQEEAAKKNLLLDK